MNWPDAAFDFNSPAPNATTETVYPTAKSAGITILVSLVVNTWIGLPSATKAIRYCADPAAPVQVTFRFAPESVT